MLLDLDVHCLGRLADRRDFSIRVDCDAGNLMQSGADGGFKLGLIENVVGFPPQTVGRWLSVQPFDQLAIHAQVFAGAVMVNDPRHFI
jgi:hypothetical protein